MAKLIEFEGIDGSGKTTALKYAAAKLREAGFRVLETREVGNPHVPICVTLRELVLSPESNLSGETMELIFSAMRLINQAFYAKVDGEYDFILNDRGWFSHLAYTDNNVSPEFTNALYNKLLQDRVGTRLPDEVVYLDVEPSVAAGRRRNRGLAADVIELKGDTFMANVRSSFEKYIERSIGKITVNRVYADGGLESVQSQVDYVVEGLTDSARNGNR